MALPGKFTDSELQRSLHSAADKLGISDFHPQQREALQAFLRGHDVFINLPTGFGKSVIFQAAPFCSDFLRQTTGSIAIVISPLTALMQDQMDSLKRKGISAACLTRDTTQETKSAINKGKFSLVFASPEAMSISARALMSTDVYKKNLCGIFIDESHCIKKWGFADGKVKAFRSEYSHLGELRSFAPANVPMVALTATATAATRRTITRSLGLRNAAMILEQPKRPNIKSVVICTKEKDIFRTFKWVLDGLCEQRADYNKTIIFCKTKAQCNTLYARFEQTMAPESTDDRCFGKFHSQTDEDVKTKIVQDFKGESSRIRVLFATVAFGMGMDVRGLHTVIHYGPPHDLEEYIQESGRVGRDGKQSVSVLVSYPGAAKLSRPDATMKEFMAATSCRRVVAMSQFEGDMDTGSSRSTCTITPHNCCDICAATCECGDDTCKDRSMVEIGLSATNRSVTSTPNLQPTRVVSIELKAILEHKLLTYRRDILEMDDHFFAGGDITSGFPRSLASQVADEATTKLSFEEFVSRYCFYDTKVAKDVYIIVEETLQDCMVNFTSSSPSSPSQLSSSSAAESDSDVEEVIHRPLLISSSDTD